LGYFSQTHLVTLASVDRVQSSKIEMWRAEFDTFGCRHLMYWPYLFLIPPYAHPGRIRSHDPSRRSWNHWATSPEHADQILSTTEHCLHLAVFGSDQKFKFGYILEGHEKENVLVYFIVIWNILRPFGIFKGHLEYLKGHFVFSIDIR
jgi:hypothetical protein